MATAAPAAPAPSTPDSTPQAPDVDVRHSLKTAFTRPESDEDQGLSALEALRKKQEAEEKTGRKVKPIPPGKEAKAPEDESEIEFEGKKWKPNDLRTELGRAQKSRELMRSVKAFQDQNKELRARLEQTARTPRPQPASKPAPAAPSRFLDSVGEEQWKIYNHLEKSDGPAAAQAYLHDLHETYTEKRVESLVSQKLAALEKGFEERYGKPTEELQSERHTERINASSQQLFQAMAAREDEEGRPLYPALHDETTARQVAALWLQHIQETAIEGRPNLKYAFSPASFRAAYATWRELNPSWAPQEEDESAGGPDPRLEEHETATPRAPVFSGAPSGVGGRTTPPTQEQVLLRSYAARANGGSDPRRALGLRTRGF